MRRSSTTLLFAFSLSLLLLQRPIFASKKSYVVYLGDHIHSAKESPLEEEEAYKRVTESHYDLLSSYPGVVSVFPNRGHKVHTTRSWKFMGLERDGAGAVAGDSLWTRARFGEDTIIANLDTGVWPESESFKDEGLGPIPSKWKGICQNDFDKSFSCNRCISLIDIP
ncbi:Subtilisin-like protease SBT5.3 [Ananas comosus]|uniref:Subtilisin-like protease SBT5.3 n=1 Tax=Ananas comosus TaxID=4615 RepID=A0A199V2E9_ANACO|nr:Subtilisin-like protease SBT5.3 [Ananas comosus]